MTPRNHPYTFARARKGSVSGEARPARQGAAALVGDARQPQQVNARRTVLPRRIDAGLSSREDRMMLVMMLAVLSFSLLPAGLEWIAYEDFANQAKDGSWRFQVQWLSVFGMAYAVLFRHAGLAWAAAKAINPLLLAMLGYTLLNIMWSVEPIISLKRVFQFGGIIATGLAFQLTRRPGAHFLNVLLVAITGILVASAVMALVNPAIGYDAGFGTAWRGILNTKNDLGFVGGLGVILWVVRADSPHARWTHVLAGLAVSALCMVKATSSTGIATSILGVSVYLVLRRRYIGSTLWLARLLVGILLVVLLLLQVFYIFEARLPLWSEIIGPFAASFGKGTDLTGRTEIWEHVFNQFLTHPFGGIGWGSFWLGPGSASQPVLDQLPWIPFQAHNGYLDMLNELGGVGMTLFVGMLLVHITQLIRMAGAEPSLAAFHGTMLAIIVFTNFSESSLYKAVSFHHILLIQSCISVSLYRYFQVTAATSKVASPVVVTGKLRGQQGSQVPL